MTQISEKIQGGMRVREVRHPSLVVDQTGVGRPVVDLFRQARLRLIPVTITGGEKQSRGEDGYHVPKRNLVSALQIAFQAGKLRIAKDLVEAETLVKELLNFRAKINSSGRDTYEAWREGMHDDLVLAVSLACWWAEEKKRYSMSEGELTGV